MDSQQARENLIYQPGIERAGDIFSFYYDETNNIRKLYLTESGLNIDQPENFVLAGILHEGLEPPTDFCALLSQLKLQKSSKELKLKHLAKGSFLELLQSPRLELVLRWIYSNGFSIHYTNLNLLYWSVVDIIDSIIGKEMIPIYVMNHASLKSDFYEIAYHLQPSFWNSLRSFQYPDVPLSKLPAFCLWLQNLVEENYSILPKDRAIFLRSLIQRSLTLGELPFISGFEAGELVENFLAEYLQKPLLFSNSKHIFDEEQHIEELLKNLALTNNGKPLNNHTFARSVEVPAIQISDVVAGLLGKYFTYIQRTTFKQITRDKLHLTPQQRRTLDALSVLVDASIEACPLFCCTVASQGEQIRRDWFLHDAAY